MAFSLPDHLQQQAPRAAPTLAAPLIELRNARAALESDLRDAMAPLLRRFYEETGVCARSIDVDMQALWPTDLTGPKHVLIGVRVALDV